jgi:hypothetical protein
MKKSGFKSILFFGLVFFISSCDGFIPDPIDPRLPVYSESGKNQAGAMINNKPYLDYPSYSFFANNSSGILNNQEDTTVNISFYLLEKDNVTASKIITFSLEKLTPADWADMEKNFGKKFSFDNPNVKGTITTFSNNGDNENLATSGQITVKHIPGSKALAGTFGFTAQDPSGIKYEVRFGRFDYIFQRF